MNKNAKTEWGFTLGRVAKELRQVLYPRLDDKKVEAISVILLCHLLVESRLNEVLYNLLIYDLPQYGGKDSEEKNKKLNDSMKEGTWNTIKKMQFMRKLELLEPAIRIWYKHLPDKIKHINDIRNDIFHGRKSYFNVLFEGKPIWEEETLEKFFLSAQYCSKELGEFYEMIDSNRAIREKWGQRLKEMGEALL